MNQKILLSLLYVVNCLDVVLSHGNGAPSSRCDSMLPGHWVDPQETPSPFQIIIDKTVVTPGDRVNITLSTVRRGQIGFKGFFVMVKEIEDTEESSDTKSEGQGKNYGFFDLASSDLKQAQPVHCFDKRNSAMTHVINDVKMSVELFWIAPYLLSEEKAKQGSPYMEKELKVVATFVKDFWTIWTDVEPTGGMTLLLTDTQQLSPKFPMSTNSRQNNGQDFRGDMEVETMPPNIAPDRNSDNIELDGSNSWDHFKRAWNYMLNFFTSTAPSS